MSRPVFKKREVYLELIICIAIALLMALSSVNISGYLNVKKVLGISTANNQQQNLPGDKKFWGEFLSKNPGYIPGWIEVGRNDKVKGLDPNYRLPW